MSLLPEPAADRTATAPYNFVPLPIQVLIPTDPPMERHNQFDPDLRSGWIDLKIETLTPLFIRGPQARDAQGKWLDRDARFRPEPFMDAQGCPLIPGSSLRGMIRTLVEILSFSKVQPVTDRRPFFRTVGADRLGDAYRHRILSNGEKPQGGYVERQPDGSWVIRPAEVLRVPRTMLTGVYFQDNPSYTPPWTHQHKPCLVRKTGAYVVDAIELTEERERKGWIPGLLVLSGNSPRKKKEFVLLEPGSTKIRIPTVLWERFHQDDQITQWQQKAYPKDKPAHAPRGTDGYLRPGEPVFFVTDSSLVSDENPDGLFFFGRPQMFRIEYDLSPADLLPDHHRSEKPDMAESMFGAVAQGRQSWGQTIKGRLRFEDGRAMGEGPWFEEIMVPKILSSPSPACFQQYLNQPNPNHQRALLTYLEADRSRTGLRGTKLYWHRWDNQGLAAARHPQNDAKLADLQLPQPKDTQCTLIRPVRTGITFTARIRFDNLQDEELGAVLAALSLPPGCAHRLGMAKPLGLGSIRITPTVTLIDRRARYACWTGTGALPITDLEEQLQKSISDFAKLIRDHCRRSGERADQGEGLVGIARLDALFCILRWENRPSRASTEYLTLGAFRPRPVLPSPAAILGGARPAYVTPTAAPVQQRQQQPAQQAQGGRPVPSAATASGIPSALNAKISTFANRTRANLPGIVAELLALPDGPVRAQATRLLLQKANALVPAPTPAERETLARIPPLPE